MITSNQPETHLDTLNVGVDTLVDVASLDYLRKQTYIKQEAVLDAYVIHGTILKAAAVAGVNRDCHYQWRKHDALNWNERWQRAVQRRKDHAEAKFVLDRLENPHGNYGTDLMAIAYMNRLDPEHWNRNLKLTHEVPNKLIQQLQALQALGNQGTQLPAPKTVEGESRVLPWE